MEPRIVESTEADTRVDFAEMCDRRGIRVGLEVGTDMGVFAAQFSERWHGDMLLCVDSYMPYKQMPYDRTGDLFMAVAALARFHGRVKIIRENSVDAARRRLLPDWLKIGFIYIDGSHEYEDVQADLSAWWPILNTGGIFAGHDYATLAHPGVTKAVHEFAIDNGLKVYHTCENDSPRSWYMLKTEADE